MARFRCSPGEARLLYLAVRYHLDRPGSELDPVTRQPAAHRLADLQASLRGAIDGPPVELTLANRQRQLLGSAMLGAVNELKVYPMLQPAPSPSGERRSVAAGFEAALLQLFPQVADDPAETETVARAMLALKRRLDLEASEEDPAPGPASGGGRRLWPFRKS